LHIALFCLIYERKRFAFARALGRVPRNTGVMEMRSLAPTQVAAPFGAYSHGYVVPAGMQLLVTSGQLGMAADGSVPHAAEAQADICFANIKAILAEAGGGPEHVIRLNAFVTDRAHFPAYMAARDRWLRGVAVLPASTLVIVSGFTRPEFLVEVEATAALPALLDA